MNKLLPNVDPLGNAVRDYFHHGSTADILVESDIAETDTLPVKHLFRKWSNLPKLEKKALKMCTGKILDVGAAAGCHSIYLQQTKKDVTALEISELCCEVLSLRGIQQVVNTDFYHYNGDTYDTLLFLMNGIGIAGTLENLPHFLQKAGALLNVGGSILFDSSDIDYLYREKDGSRWVNLNSKYYGELNYRMSYKEITGNYFPWLFIDFDTLKPVAEKQGFRAEKIADGKHFDYLGKLTKL